MTTNSNQVLAQLDAAAEEFRFPVLDNLHTELAGSRLTVYFNPSKWAIAIEVVGFTARCGDEHSFNTKIYCYGSEFADNFGVSDDRILFPVTAGTSGSVLSEPPWLNMALSDVSIRDRLIAVSFEDSFYSEAGVRLV